jgi:hypothetical protein
LDLLSRASMFRELRFAGPMPIGHYLPQEKMR